MSITMIIFDNILKISKCSYNMYFYKLAIPACFLALATAAKYFLLFEHHDSFQGYCTEQGVQSGGSLTCNPLPPFGELTIKFLFFFKYNFRLWYFSHSFFNDDKNDKIILISLLLQPNPPSSCEIKFFRSSVISNLDPQ